MSRKKMTSLISGLLMVIVITYCVLVSFQANMAVISRIFGLLMASVMICCVLISFQANMAVISGIFGLLMSRASGPIEQRAYHLFVGGVASLAVFASPPNDKSGTEIAKLTTKVDETKEEIILMRKKMNEDFQNVLRVKEERLKEKHRNSFLSRIVKFFKRVD